MESFPSPNRLYSIVFSIEAGLHRDHELVGGVWLREGEYAHLSTVRRIFEENHTNGARSCDDECISTCPFPEETTKGRDASYAHAARSTSAVCIFGSDDLQVYRKP
jgi:hypothetical protein